MVFTGKAPNQGFQPAPQTPVFLDTDAVGPTFCNYPFCGEQIQGLPYQQQCYNQAPTVLFPTNPCANNYRSLADALNQDPYLGITGDIQARAFVSLNPNIPIPKCPLDFANISTDVCGPTLACCCSPYGYGYYGQDDLPYREQPLYGSAGNFEYASCCKPQCHREGYQQLYGSQCDTVGYTTGGPFYGCQGRIPNNMCNYVPVNTGGITFPRGCTTLPLGHITEGPNCSPINNFKMDPSYVMNQVHPGYGVCNPTGVDLL